MDNITLTQEQKNRILDCFINTRMTFSKIALQTNTTVEQVYQVINKYYEENGCKIVKRGRNVVIIKQDQRIVEVERKEFKRQKYYKDCNKINLNNAQEIEKWFNQYRKKPREGIKGVKTIKKREEETEEQTELRLGQSLKYIRKTILKKYKGKKLEEIENEQDREIVRIIRNLIIELIDTKDATQEQIQTMAEYYGVSLEGTEYQIEETKTLQTDSSWEK